MMLIYLVTFFEDPLTDVGSLELSGLGSYFLSKRNSTEVALL